MRNARSAQVPLAAAALAATLGLAAWTMALLGAHHLLLNDFRAFYCGGRAVLHGQNPYLSGSLVACESAHAPFGLNNAAPGMVEPVPLPGYAFFALMPFGALPLVPAAAAWLTMLIALSFASAFALARLIGKPAAGVIAVFGAGFAMVLWTYGETAPIALFALILAAFALRNRRFGELACALCVCALLPHLAAPVMLAVFVWEKRARVPLVAGAAVLLLLDLSIGGPRVAFSYFTSVLPAHAHAEIPYITQYSLTWMLHALGAGDRAALLCGDLSYAALAALGIVLGGRLMRRFNDAAFIVLVPAAFAVIAGSFIHYAEILLALPAAMLLCARAKGPAYALACTALVLIAIPWQWELVGMILPAVIAAGCIAIVFLDLPVLAAMAAVGAAAALSALVLSMGAAYGNQIRAIAISALPHADPSLAPYAWGVYIGEHFASSGIVWWIAKAPTWIGLLLLALGCAYVLVQEDLVARVAVEKVPVAP